jgi:hypothetical protein
MKLIDRKPMHHATALGFSDSASRTMSSGVGAVSASINKNRSAGVFIPSHNSRLRARTKSEHPWTCNKGMPTRLSVSLSRQSMCEYAGTSARVLELTSALIGKCHQQEASKTGSVLGSIALTPETCTFTMSQTERGGLLLGMPQVVLTLTGPISFAHAPLVQL